MSTVSLTELMLEQFLILHRQVKLYCLQQKEILEKNYPDQIEGIIRLHFIANVLLKDIKEKDEE